MLPTSLLAPLWRSAAATTCCRVAASAGVTSPPVARVLAAAPRAWCSTSRFDIDEPADVASASPSWVSALDGRDLAELQSQRPALWRPDPLNAFEKRWYYLLKVMRVYSVRAQTGAFSEALFRSVEEQASQVSFYNALGLDHDFQTEHALVVLHTWILHCRLKVDYDGKGLYCGRRMQEQLFERLWEACTLKIRNVGVPEMRVNKQLETLQKVAFRDMQEYDAAVKVVGEDDHVALMVALWHQVFKGNADVSTETVLQLVDYTRREVLNVMQLPKEDFYHGWIPWGPAVGETADDRLARQRALFEGQWREGIHVDGRLYFHHTTSRQRQWDVPKELPTHRVSYALLKHLESKGVDGKFLAHADKGEPLLLSERPTASE